MPSWCARPWWTCCPPGSIVLVPHAHFGVDLSPGLSIKLDAAYVPDVVDIEGVEGRWLKAVRQEFGGLVQRARPLRHFDWRGAEHPAGRVPAVGNGRRQRER